MAQKTVSVVLAARVEQYLAAMAKASAATGQFAASAKASSAAVNSSMGQTAAAADRSTTAIGKYGKVAVLGLAGVGVAAVKSAVDWESSWAGVSKTVDGTTEQMSSLEKGLREMTGRMPASHAEIAKVAEVAGQLGVKVGDIEDFTEVMIGLGESTNMSAEEAATSLARFMNVMGTSQADVERLGSTIVDLGNNYATTESEITEFGTRLAAAGKIAGLSEADVLAFGAAASSVGVQAEAGGTALSKVFVKIRDSVLQGGSDLQTLADVAGMTARQFSDAFNNDPAMAISSFIAGLGRMNAEGQSTSQVFKDLALNDQRLIRTLLSTAEAGDLLTDSLKSSRQAWDENSALDTEVEKRYATLASQLEMLRNRLVDLGITMGDGIAPYVESLVGQLKTLGDVAEVTFGVLGELEKKYDSWIPDFPGKPDNLLNVDPASPLKEGAEFGIGKVQDFLTPDISGSIDAGAIKANQAYRELIGTVQEYAR